MSRSIFPLAWDIRGWADTNPLNGAVWSLQWEYVANILYATIVRRFRTWVLALLVAVSAVLTLILCFNLDFTGWLKAREGYAAYTVIGGWSMDPDQLQVGVTRLFYPFFSGLLLARLKWIIPVRRGGFLLCSALISIAFAMLYFASAPWQNGLYEAAVISPVLPARPLARRRLGDAERHSGPVLQVRGGRLLPDLHRPPANHPAALQLGGHASQRADRAARRRGGVRRPDGRRRRLGRVQALRPARPQVALKPGKTGLT